MLLTTTNQIQNKNIKEYKGFITADVIYGANVFRDFFAALRDFFGGRSIAYENVINNAKKQALAELEQKAKLVGANAVIGIDFDFEAIGANGSMLLVSASGTAVVVED